MFVNFGVYDQDSVKEGRRIFVQDMVDLHSNRSVSPIGASLANQGAKGSKPNKRTGTGQPKDNNDFVDTESNNATLKYKAIDVFERMRRSSDLKNQAMLHLTGKASNAAEEKEVLQALKKACNDSYDDFIRHWKYQIDNHWEEVIKAYPSKKFSDEYDDWSDVAKRAFSRHCHNRNYLQVGQYFDLMGWWRVHSSNWQYVFPSAVIWLAKPATNAFQERIFSMGSWMLQNKLMGSMSKKTSEMRTMEYINRQVLRTIEENEEEIAKGNGTSKTYDKRIIRKDDTAITAAVRLSLSEQRKKFQKSAVLDAANGFQQYKLSWKVDTSVLDDPDIGSTFFPVQSAKVTKKPTALNDNDDDNSPSGNDIPVPPPEEVPKVAGVVPPIPDDQAEIGQDKTGQDKTGKRYGWPTYGEKTSPLKYNRFVFTNIKDDYEDSSDDDSIPPPPKEPDEESDAVIDHVLDSELWDEAVPDDELCFEKIVCIPDDDPINKAPKGTVNDDDEVKVVKVVPAGENSKSKGTPSPKASISSKKAVAHAPDTGSKKGKGIPITIHLHRPERRQKNYHKQLYLESGSRRRFLRKRRNAKKTSIKAKNRNNQWNVMRTTRPSRMKSSIATKWMPTMTTNKTRWRKMHRRTPMKRRNMTMMRRKTTVSREWTRQPMTNWKAVRILTVYGG